MRYHPNLEPMPTTQDWSFQDAGARMACPEVVAARQVPAHPSGHYSARRLRVNRWIEMKLYHILFRFCRDVDRVCQSKIVVDQSVSRLGLQPRGLLHLELVRLLVVRVELRRV